MSNRNLPETGLASFFALVLLFILTLEKKK